MSQRKVNQEGRNAMLSAGGSVSGRKGNGKKPGGPSSGKPGAGRRGRWTHVLQGFILGMLIGHVASLLGVQSIPVLRTVHLAPVMGVLGALLALTRGWWLLWWAAGTLCLGWLVLGYTPLIVRPVRTLVVRDRLQPVEAVVVLSSDIHPSGALTTAAQVRLLKGYEMLRDGYARTLVLTRLPAPKKSYLPAVREQMRVLGMSHPILETGAVTNTHDEAVKVSALARERGWKRMILVSDAIHMKRAKAVFAKAGLPVLCAPSASRDFDLATLEVPSDRVHAFREWLWETIGMQVYKRNGWI